MMRAALILVGVVSLVAMELEAPPRVAKAVDQPFTLSTVGAGVGASDSRDTLAKADRLEIPYFQNHLSIPPISSVERMPPADSTPAISKEAGKTVSVNRPDLKTRDVKTKNVKTRQVASVAPKPSSRIPDSRPRLATTASKSVANTTRSKAPMDAKPCRPNAFDSFLKALNLPSGCEA
jgi:hypothetical protein